MSDLHAPNCTGDDRTLCGTERALVAAREMGISKTLERRLVAQAVGAAKVIGECQQLRDRELKRSEHGE